MNPQDTAILGDYQDSVDAALAKLRDGRMLGRIWAHDHTLWKVQPEEIIKPLVFGVLDIAQALGDRQALLEAGRRVIRLHLGRDITGGIERSLEAIS